MTAPTACGNVLDDDADGRADFPEDPGCVAAGDGDEADPAETPQCADGLDNDADGHTDFPEDSGCAGRGTTFEGEPRTPTACADGLDNDADGATDYPEDVDCVAAAARSEEAPGGCGGTHHVLDLNRALAGAEYVEGDTSQGAEGFVGTCGGNAGPEIVYSFRVAEVVGAIEFTTEFPETVVPTVLYVRSVCDDPRDVGCNRGSAEVPGTHVRLERPEVGVYYVVVDTSMADQSGVFRLGALTVEAPRCSDARDNDLDGRPIARPGLRQRSRRGRGGSGDPPRVRRRPRQRRRRPDRLPRRSHLPRGRRSPGDRGHLRAEAPNLILMDATGGMIHVSTDTLANDYTSTCGGNATGPEQVIAVVVDRAAFDHGASTINNGFDTVLHARSVCDDAAITQYACDDDGGAIGVSSRLISFAVTRPGRRLHLRRWLQQPRRGDGRGSRCNDRGIDRGDAMSFFRQAASVLATSVATVPLSILANVVVTRNLDPEARGQFAVVSVLAGTLVLFSNLGWPLATIYRMKRMKSDPAEVMTASLTATLSLAATVLIIGALLEAGGFGDFGTCRARSCGSAWPRCPFSS